eukprot:m51a1_g7315 hypothetical protein (118) ;mRNA; r:135748-136470
MCGAHSVAAYAPAGSGSACSKALSDFPRLSSSSSCVPAPNCRFTTPMVPSYWYCPLCAPTRSYADGTAFDFTGTLGIVNLQYGLQDPFVRFHIVGLSGVNLQYTATLNERFYIQQAS